MSNSGYDTERVTKISQIMPQFSKVAQAGDTVLMGLEGDPLFPSDFSKSRPTATITSVKQRENDYLVELKTESGEKKQFSSLSLAADQVWEFDDVSFRNVMERQRVEQEKMNQKVKPPEYRGAEDVSSLKAQVSELKDIIEAERQNTRNFHNTMIASMNEMASDICKLDGNGSTKFCRVLNNEYTKLMESRAEGGVYRGVDEYESEDFSADDTDFF